MTPQYFDIIPSHNIDAYKWDNCIKNSKTSNIYASYIYLQHMADDWSGLVMNDYAAVMPITWRRKWNIRYAYHAPFIQQLGLFGRYNVADLQQAVNKAMQYVRYGDLFFNHTNAIQHFFPSARAAINLVIPLHTGYQIINKGYSNHLKTKLRKAGTQSLQYVAESEIELAIQTYQQLYAQRFPFVKPDNYQRLKNVAGNLLLQQQCFVRQVRDKQNNLLAIALFFKDENRIYNILPSTKAQGRKMSAMHFLMDHVLQEFAGMPFIFDFEGSDVPSIKEFYQSFGAVNEPYYHLHYNHLPVPLKWLKR